MSDWQPIETAPKDGTRIIVFCDRALGDIFTANWHSIQQAVDGEVAYRVEGWWLGGFDHPFNTPPFCPTHWMPLPNPPADIK